MHERLSPLGPTETMPSLNALGFGLEGAADEASGQEGSQNISFLWGGKPPSVFVRLPFVLLKA